MLADQLKQFGDTERQTRLNDMKQKLAQEVAAGKITQAQMDTMAEKMSSAPTHTSGKPFIGGFIRGGHREFKNKTNNTTATPSTTQVQ